MKESEANQPAASEKDAVALGHTYDGIQEYDNPTPLWWDGLFVLSILFAPLYIFWFHAPLEGRTLEERYQVSLAENMRRQFGEIGTLEPTEATLLTYMNDEEWLNVGQATFKTNCVSCHGQEGEGISGPNLTDDYYLNVKTIEDIAKVVANGAKKGAMPAWANRLHPNEVVLVSSYVASLRGGNLTGKRPQEGNLIDPWPAPPAAPPAAAEAEEQTEG